MATPADVPTISLITLPRAVLSVAAGVLDTVERAVVGDARVRTARGNAWEAMCADQARAQTRDEMRRLVAALAASMPDQTPDGGATGSRATGGQATGGQRTVGSSPRSSASHAALVSTGPAARD